VTSVQPFLRAPPPVIHIPHVTNRLNDGHVDGYSLSFTVVRDYLQSM